MWRELVDVLERQCEAETEDDKRVNILSRKARMYTEKLQRDDAALEDWNRVLDLDFANLGALRAVAAIRRRAGDQTELVNALHQIVDRAAAMLEPEELKEIFRELGKTYGEQLGQPFDAADAWRKLLEVGPDFEAMDALEAIYRGEEKWTDVIDVKMQRAAALEDPAQKIEEYRQVAQLWRETVQEPDRATPAWQRILESDAAHDEAFSELEKLHTAAGRWEPLVELYLARLDTREETADKTDMLRRIARVFEEHLDDRNQALDALINALGEDFHDRETAKYLERMAQATGRWNEVITTANGWLKEQSDPQQKIRLCLHLAKWYGDDLGKPEYAQPYYAQIVQLDPNNVGALRQMGQLYRKSGNNQQYGHSLTKALEVAINDIDRKEIQNELGELLDGQMNQTDQAITYFHRALEVDPQFLPALENLERIYNARGQNRELVDILTRKVVALSEPAEIAATKLRIGALYEGTLGDPQKAAQVYRETLEVDAANLQAMRGLARTCELLEQWTELVKVLEQQLDVVSTERERIDVLMQLANLQEEHFLKSDIAAQRLEQVVEIDPSHEEAYVALERNYRKMRQWHELIQTYERHISTTLERKTKVELYGYVAQVQSEEIGDADKAIEAYQNIVDLEDTNVPALDALSKLHEKRGDATQAIDFMTRVADLTQDSKQRVELFYRIGKALDEKLGDRVAAQDRYEMALDIDPSHLLTLAALRAIAMDNADYDKAARLLDQEQMHTQGARQKARLLVELGNLRESTLSEHEGAVAAWEGAIEADPENEDAASPLGNHYIEQQSWEKAEPLFELLVRKSGKRERTEQHDLQNKLGQVTAALGKDDKALKAYTAAHQLDITDQVTIKGLAEVSFRLKDWGNALTNYQKVLTALAEDENEARADVYYKLGCIKREQGQAKQAINNYEKALAVNAAHRPTLEAMVSLYTELRDYKQVVAYKRQILDNVFEGDERFKILNEIGETWRDLDKSPAKAIEAFEEALDLQPTSHPLLHTLLALYQSTENWPKMIDTIQAIADLEKDPIRKIEVHLHDGADLSRQGERSRTRGGALQCRARLESPVPRGVRAHQQGPHGPKRVEAARTQLPQDAQAHARGDGEPRARVQLVAQPRHHLSRSPPRHAERHRSLQDGDPLQAGRGGRKANLRGALRGDGPDGGRDRRARDRSAEGPDARRPVSEPLQALHEAARVRPRVVHVRGARFPPQGRRRRAALLRGLSPAWHDPGQEPPRQRAMGQEPVPQGRERLHRQDHGDDHAGGDRREDDAAPCLAAASSPRQAVQAGSVEQHRDVCQDVRMGSAGSRGSTSRALRSQRRARCARRSASVAARERRRGHRPHGFCSPGADVHHRQAPLVLPRRALHQESLPDAERAQGAALRGDEGDRRGLQRSSRTWRPP